MRDMAVAVTSMATCGQTPRTGRPIPEKMMRITGMVEMLYSTEPITAMTVTSTGMVEPCVTETQHSAPET